MSVKAISGLATVAFAAASLAMPGAAMAQSTYTATGTMSEQEVQSLPAEYRVGPAVAEHTETSIDADGVETIIRTRRIERSAPYPAQEVEYETEHYAYRTMPAPTYAPAASVFERDQWIEECERRTRGRGDREKGGIIGGLLGAIAGGIIGNRVSDGERLAGTLIGAGTGGIAGVLLGTLVGGGRDDHGDYDCEAALDSYLSQYGYPGTRYAVRSIPTPAPYGYPGYAPAPAHYGYGYLPAYQGYSYSYAPPQQIVYVPVHYQQQQRVIVRETVREEVEYVPGAAREIPAPAPTPAPAPAPQPREPIYIKGD